MSDNGRGRVRRNTMIGVHRASLATSLALWLAVSAAPQASGGVAAGADFAATPAIWPHADAPLVHEVALFRSTFSIEAPITGAQIEAFADTRYEVWLDGVWIGRGPARFTRGTHEYDAHALRPLASGAHQLAVLVQWSPNLRRSESVRPLLQLRVTAAGRVLTQTGPAWRAARSPAWNAKAPPVHTWQLIGATEQLDLGQLPADWMQPTFNDARWAYAVQLPRPQARYLPRSIPMLIDVPMPVAVSKRGWLANGARLIELQPDANGDHSVPVASSPGAVIAIETLAVMGAPQIDIEMPRGATGAWTPSGDRHPDLRRAVITLTTAAPRLVFRNIPAQGWPVLIAGAAPQDGTLGAHLSVANAAHTNPAFAHAGRRLLLAQPRDDPGAVAIESAGTGKRLSFAGAPSFTVLDLGRVVHGRLEAVVYGPRGAMIDVGWAERTWRDGYPLPYLGSLYPEWSPVDTWTLDGARRRISTIDSRAGRYVLIAVWADAPVRFEDVRVVEERYPVRPHQVFSSGDARLDRIWRVGRDTAMLNMLDAYADPWRERGQWWGDAFVVDRVNEAVFGDDALMRRGLLFGAEQVNGTSAASPGASTTTHTDRTGHLRDFGMLWVQGIRRYIDRSGDASILVECYPAVQRFMADLARLEQPATGLLDMPELDWSESALIDWPAFYNPSGSVAHGLSTPLNAMYFKTLQDAAAIAAWAGDDAFTAAWSARARQVREGINAVLFLPREGRYLSTIIEGRPVSPTLYAQAWPLAYDVVPAERVTGTVQALLELISRDPDAPNVEPYGMFWVLEALGRVGRVDAGIDLIELYYGRLLDLGATTWWETWDADLDPRKSLSHGWGSAPTWFLSTYAQHLETRP